MLISYVQVVELDYLTYDKLFKQDFDSGESTALNSEIAFYVFSHFLV